MFFRPRRPRITPRFLYVSPQPHLEFTPKPTLLAPLVERIDPARVEVPLPFHASKIPPGGVMTKLVRASAVFLLIAAAAFAQTSRGTVTGLVTDASGAAIPSASVELKSISTGVLRAAATNDSGLYRLRAVDPGSYEIAISKAGFKATKSNAFDIAAAQIASIVRIPGQGERDSGLKANTFWSTPEWRSPSSRN
ncbi:MAG: carboxypeptidase regulatory-like domain-containing protein [Acidobacteriia bacterium]|nr:carboxypeptidase regulatory-like domain-containing protein [Terriglobia bacterium]